MKEVVILIVYDQHNESRLYHIYQNIKIKLKSTFDNQIKPYSSHNWNIVSKWHWNFECKIQIEGPSNNKRLNFVGVLNLIWKKKAFEIVVIKFLHLSVIDCYTLMSEYIQKSQIKEKWLYFYCLSIITTTFIDKVIVLLPICYFWFVCFPFQWCFSNGRYKTHTLQNVKICKHTINKKKYFQQSFCHNFAFQESYIL